jgi:hypothetical protein
MIKQGLQVKIVNGENAGRQGVVVAKAPGSAAKWMVQVEGKGQIRFEEKDLKALS